MWYVARSIYNDEDYEVWEIFVTEKECKKYIASLPKSQQKEFFYFQKKELAHPNLPGRHRFVNNLFTILVLTFIEFSFII